MSNNKTFEQNNKGCNEQSKIDADKSNNVEGCAISLLRDFPQIKVNKNVVTPSLPEHFQIEEEEGNTAESANTNTSLDDADGRKSIVSGNGYGYAVLSPNGDLSKLYAHPYRFEKPDPDPTKEGSPTLNFIQSMSWQSNSSTDNSTSQQQVETKYLNESGVMQVTNGSNHQLYFMPFGLHRNALVTTIQSDTASDLNANIKSVWTKTVDKEEQLNVSGRDVKLVTFKDAPEAVAIINLDSSREDAKKSETAFAIVPLESKAELTRAINDVNLWQQNKTPEMLAQTELKEQEQWRVKPNVTFRSAEEKSVWRQSESILRMAQIQETNNSERHNNGLINASLPNGEWFIPWVRDMSYAVNGLTKMGHTDEARKGLMAYFNAGETKMQSQVRGEDYKISVVRYYGNGAEEADYSGEKSPNVELDNWGLVLWTAGEYFAKTRDKSFLQEQVKATNPSDTKSQTVYESMRDSIVKPLLANTDKQGDGIIVTADSSPWEEHQENKKHFAFSTIMAIRGLRGFQSMAEAMQDKEAVTLVGNKITDLEKGFESAFVENGALKGTLEKSFAHDIDGSLVEAFNFDVEKDPAILENTLKKMELMREPSGGFRRVRGDTNYERQEFLMINFYMSRLYFKLGRDKEGMDLLNQMIDSAHRDKDRIPEMYVSELNDEFPGKIGTPTGALPMVGYGAGAFVMTLEEREENARKRAHEQKKVN